MRRTRIVVHHSLKKIIKYFLFFIFFLFKLNISEYFFFKTLRGRGCKAALTPANGTPGLIVGKMTRKTISESLQSAILTPRNDLQYKNNLLLHPPKTLF